jgi:hypothetical protein
VFSPVVLAGIGSLPGTLNDRAIVVRLARAKPGEVTSRFDSRHIEPETTLCRKLARAIADNFDALKRCDPQLPGTAFNRLADNWRPLFAIAEIAGGHWPKRCADAYAKLTATDDLDAHGIGTLLLADIAEIYRDEHTDKIPSARICELLVAHEGRPWAEWDVIGNQSRLTSSPISCAGLESRRKLSALVTRRHAATCWTTFQKRLRAI